MCKVSIILNSFVLHMEQDGFLHDACVVQSVNCKLDFSGCTLYTCMCGRSNETQVKMIFLSQPLVIHDFMND